MTWNMARNIEKIEKWKMHTLGPEIQRENWQMRERRNSHNRTWNIARNTEKREKWDTHTVGPEIWQENDKRGKGEAHI